MEATYHRKNGYQKQKIIMIRTCLCAPNQRLTHPSSFLLMSKHHLNLVWRRERRRMRHEALRANAMVNVTKFDKFSRKLNGDIIQPTSPLVAKHDHLLLEGGGYLTASPVRGLLYESVFLLHPSATK